MADTNPYPWKSFCRALSTADLPECELPELHEGGHVFAHVPAEKLLDRCATMLRELSGEPPPTPEEQAAMDAHSGDF